MARREWGFMVVCGHEGCGERATYRYQTRRDMAESFEVKNYSGGRWKCVRHSRPDEVLSESNRQTSIELTVEQKPYGRYFGNTGFLSGPGFKAFAADFPAGAKVIVSAVLILPDDEDHSHDQP